MGRPKRELKKIHRKKVKKAKQTLKLYAKGETAYAKLTQRAKDLLQKGKKKKASLA